MEPIIKIRDLGKTWQSRQRDGQFRSRVKNIEAHANVDLDIFPGHIGGSI